ncbi:MAG: hypothetical protein ACLP8S_08345 [Solirubrobacteraceae bacterium]
MPRHVHGLFVVLATVGATSCAPRCLVTHLSMPSIIGVMIPSKLGWSRLEDPASAVADLSRSRGWGT